MTKVVAMRMMVNIQLDFLQIREEGLKDVGV